MLKNNKEQMDKLINILKNNEYLSYADIVKIYGHKITDAGRIDDMIKILVNEEYSSYEDVAKMYGTTRQAAYDIINMYNLKWYYNKHRIKIKDKLEKILNEEKYTTYEDVAKLVDCTPSSISILIPKYNLQQLYNTNKVKKKNSGDKIKNILENEIYYNHKDIANIYGCNTAYIGKSIKKYNLTDLYNKNKSKK